LPRLHVLPHGIDTACFHPVPTPGARSSAEASRTEIRRKLFPDRPELAEAFVVLNANFPYPRKRIDLTIHGFAAFVQAGAPDAYLYLHHVRIDRYLRQQIERIAGEVALSERLLLNTLNPQGQPVSDEHLDLLHNACDVGLTTAMGEAWGLASFEHGATGAAQIVPDHTSFRENWHGAAEFMQTNGHQHLFYEYADMNTVEPAEVARALQGYIATVRCVDGRRARHWKEPPRPVTIGRSSRTDWIKSYGAA
jgi:glycosyltransferase involved in cell wall biosynthesis